MINKSKFHLFALSLSISFLSIGCAASAPPSTDISDATSAEPAQSVDWNEDALIEGALTKKQLLKELKDGGEVLYFRHISTDGKPYKDQQDAVMGDCSTQRVIGQKGWAEALSIKEGIEAVGISIGDVQTSEYCRVWQTASLIFGEFALNPTLTAMSANPSNQEKSVRKSDAIALFSTIPENANTVLVGHSDVFKLVTGIKPEPQGIAYMLKPEGDTFAILGSIAPEEW